MQREMQGEGLPGVLSLPGGDVPSISVLCMDTQENTSRAIMFFFSCDKPLFIRQCPGLEF